MTHFELVPGARLLAAGIGTDFRQFWTKFRLRVEVLEVAGVILCSRRSHSSNLMLAQCLLGNVPPYTPALNHAPARASLRVDIKKHMLF